jgi:hypothetical protein
MDSGAMSVLTVMIRSLRAVDAHSCHIWREGGRF